MDWEKILERLKTLLENGRHSELRGALRMLNIVDIAQFLEELDNNNRLLVFRILPKDISADVFSYMSVDAQQSLISLIGDQEISALIHDMFLDDAVDFLEEMPANVVKRILQHTDPQTRDLINQFLRYPENSAGSIMTIEYMEVHEQMTVGQTMDLIRKVGLDKETIYTIYVIDKARHLIGAIPLRKLILEENTAIVDNIMNRSIHSVPTSADQEAVADLARKYDLLAIPVVDAENRLVGIITADDVMDVIEEENTEDFERMAALTPAEGEYLHTSSVRLALNRIPWLLLLSVAAIFTGMIITSFETLLKNADVVLTACIPMLMDTGGNCGAQVSTLMIRGLALNELSFKDLFKILWKEFRVGLMIGFVLSIFTFVRVLLVNQATAAVSLVVSLALFCTVILAKIIGCCLPLLAKRFKLDPAMMASPLITTIVDAAALALYFSIAKVVLF